MVVTVRNRPDNRPCNGAHGGCIRQPRVGSRVGTRADSFQTGAPVVLEARVSCRHVAHLFMGSTAVRSPRARFFLDLLPARLSATPHLSSNGDAWFSWLVAACQ